MRLCPPLGRLPSLLRFLTPKRSSRGPGRGRRFINLLHPATITMNRSFSSRSLPFTPALLSLLVVFAFSSLSVLPSTMADATTKHPAPEEATVQIVYVQKPETEEPEAFHIRTLAAVLGSEDAAKESLIYHYTHAASGFSAKLTKSQVEELSKQPGVLQVVPSRTVSLMGGTQPHCHRC